MDIKKLLEINAEIEKIKSNPILNNFEKYYELLILRNEYENEKKLATKEKGASEFDNLFKWDLN